MSYRLPNRWTELLDNWHVDYWPLSEGFRGGGQLDQVKGKGTREAEDTHENWNKSDFFEIETIYITQYIRNNSRISAPFVNCKGAQRGAEDPHENPNMSNFDEI